MHTAFDVLGQVVWSEGGWSGPLTGLAGAWLLLAVVFALLAPAKRRRRRIETALRDLDRFMAVVTATGRHAYRRPDGVCVVPLSTLAP